MEKNWIDKLADKANWTVIAIAILCLVIYIIFNAEKFVK